VLLGTGLSAHVGLGRLIIEDVPGLQAARDPVLRESRLLLQPVRDPARHRRPQVLPPALEQVFAFRSRGCGRGSMLDAVGSSRRVGSTS
jgi:hypothetical protein